MANHASAEKRARQSEKRRLHNKAIRNTTDKEAATALLPKVFSMLDKLAKINVIHANKASNLKSGIANHVSKL
jgi:small subunit ribosomal protein S20